MPSIKLVGSVLLRREEEVIFYSLEGMSTSEIVPPTVVHRLLHGSHVSLFL